MYKKYEAFVLDKYIYKTSSLLVKLITKTSVETCISYSARKNTKHFGSDLEALAKLEVVFTNLKSKELQTLKETSIIKLYKNIAPSIYASVATFYIKEIISNIAYDFDEQLDLHGAGQLDLHDIGQPDLHGTGKL